MTHDGAAMTFQKEKKKKKEAVMLIATTFSQLLSLCLTALKDSAEAERGRGEGARAAEETGNLEYSSLKFIDF